MRHQEKKHSRVIILFLVLLVTSYAFLTPGCGGGNTTRQKVVIKTGNPRRLEPVWKVGWAELGMNAGDYEMGIIEVTDNTLVSSSDRYLSAYDTSDGHRLWLHSPFGKMMSYGAIPSFKVYGKSLFEPRAYDANQAECVIAELDPRTGRKLLDYDIRVGKQPHPFPFYDFDMSNKYLVVVDGDGNVKAIDRLRGKALWEQSHTGSNSSAIVNDLVFVNGGRVAAIKLSSGKQVWERDIDADKLFSIAPDLLIVSIVGITANTERALYALDTKTGRDVWVNKGLSALSFAASEGRLIVFGLDRNEKFILTCFDPSTGKELWSFDPGGYWEEYEEPTPVPVIVDGVVYFNCYDTFIYALDINTGKPIDKYLLKSSAVLATDGQYVYASDVNYFYKFMKIQKPQ